MEISFGGSTVLASKEFACSRKRFKKILMGHGYSRNQSEKIAWDYLKAHGHYNWFAAVIMGGIKIS